MSSPPSVLAMEGVTAGWELLKWCSTRCGTAAAQAGTPVTLLGLQYRMVDAICKWPSAFFYDSRLLNGRKPADWKCAPTMRHAYCSSLTVCSLVACARLSSQIAAPPHLLRRQDGPLFQSTKLQKASVLRGRPALSCVQAAALHAAALLPGAGVLRCA